MPNETKAPEFKTDATWFIEPRSPLVFRTGRVGLHGSAGKEVFDFPVPGTVAGAVRAAYADANDWNFTKTDDHKRLVESVAVHGPLLASQPLTGGELTVVFPKPADAIYIKDPATGRSSVYTAYPQTPVPDEGCDLPHPDLLPVVLDASALAKPIEGPAFWDKSAIKGWLLGADFISAPEQCGMAAPSMAVRTHMQMDRERRANKDGGLFESAGINAYWAGTVTSTAY